MSYKKIIPCILMKAGLAVDGLHSDRAAKESADSDMVTLAKSYSDNGADGIMIFDLSDSDQEHEQSLGMIKNIFREIEVPLICGGNVKRMEDVKKLIYAGAQKVMLNLSKENNKELLVEVSKRFGKEKMAACIECFPMIEEDYHLVKEYANEIIVLQGHLLSDMELPYEVPVLPILDDITMESIESLLTKEPILGIAGKIPGDSHMDIKDMKNCLKEKGIPVSMLENSLNWTDFKLNSDGMVPVIVQDYRTNQVLMMAYMNQKAFEHSISTGRMTYWSRSRNELWVKGLTSGHYQYIKSLSADCDYDTILAKVSQAGAACHTGEISCFFRNIAKKEGERPNPLKVFEDVYEVIANRKEKPKEGSYTNYLFDKGIDKILKKIGEEAAEIIIAAKNPEPEEIKYEISDFLYHVMVLMVEKGVTWEDITEELAAR